MTSGKFIMLLGLMGALAACAAAAPQVANPGFEQDRYTTSPGYRFHNGGAIAGWEGGSGVNPVWRDPENQRGPDAPFADNGRIPEGRQVAFIQGPGRLSQRVEGFVAGRTYRVTFRSNARVTRRGTQWPRLQATLGGTLIVSPHEVRPVTRIGDYTAPYCRVVSGPFVPPEDGAYELVLETVQQSPTTTVLLDDVRIVEEPAQPD